MERSIKVVIPAVDNSQHYIKQELIEDIVHDITRQFGGVTVYPQAAGCWINRDGNMDCDKVSHSYRRPSDKSRSPGYSGIPAGVANRHTHSHGP